MTRPRSTTTDPYRVLGVSRGADADTIKAAYRKLALDNHPDRNPGDARAEERFKEMSQAYATLRDPQARARYDRFGPDAERAPDFRAADFSTVDWQTLFQEADIHISRERWQGVPGGAGPDVQGTMMFRALFGVMTGLMRQSGLLPGEDRETAVRLSLEEARQGLERRVRVPGPSVCPSCRGSGTAAGVAPSRPAANARVMLRGAASAALACSQCAGEGVVRGGAEVDVAVPAGVAPHSKLRLRGLGGPGNPPGDAFVRVQLELPAGARLQGKDVVAELPLLPQEAARGAQLERYGAHVRVPPGTKDGDSLRVAGAGVAGGDLVLRARVGWWRGALRRAAELVA